MTILEVGRPFGGRTRTWPETTEYVFSSDGHMLRLFFAGPSAQEVEDVRRGPCAFALYVEQPLILLCHRFGSMPWSDAPFSWHLVPPEHRSLPSADLEQSKQAVLHVVLVDAANGIVRALRQLTIGHDFSVALHSAIRDQAAAPWDASAYDRALQRLYALHQSDWLAEHAVAHVALTGPR